MAQGATGRAYTQLVETLQSDRDKACAAHQFQEHRKKVEKNAGEAILTISNRIYIQRGYQFSKTFDEIAISKFAAGTEVLNYFDAAKSAAAINNFVEEKTNGKITDLISPDQFDSRTRLILVNAIYFNGNWEHPFKKSHTHKGDFYITETEAVPIDFMNMDREFNAAFIEELDATALEMDYANSNISFVILLPQSRTGLSAFETKLKDYDLTKLDDSLKLHRYDAHIPKFKVEYRLKLNDVLENVCFEISLVLLLLLEYKIDFFSKQFRWE